MGGVEINDCSCNEGPNGKTYYLSGTHIRHIHLLSQRATNAHIIPLRTPHFPSVAMVGPLSKNKGAKGKDPPKNNSAQVFASAATLEEAIKALDAKVLDAYQKLLQQRKEYQVLKYTGVHFVSEQGREYPDEEEKRKRESQT